MYAAKAIAGAIATLVNYLVWRDVGAPPEVEAAIFTIIVTVVVYLVPNRGTYREGPSA